MGDDAELYWEMEHDPHFWDSIEKYLSGKEKTKNQNKRKNKRNTVVFIDGENISSKKSKQIMDIVHKQGMLGIAKVYGLQKDARTRAWSDAAKVLKIEDIRLCGSPEKDKVDKKIEKDIKTEIQNNKSVDIVCIVTSDKGYTKIIKELKEKGKKVVGIGEKKAPKELRDVCSVFVEI